MNPLKQLEKFGQSIWIDYIKRDMIHNGNLKKLIDDDGIQGMTSNPDIFEKAIADSHDYDTDIQKMVLAKKNIEEIYAELTQQDVRDAADVFRPLYDRKKGGDGFVSLEVNPHFAHDTNATIKEARELWKALNRPNVFIKVPATKEGLPAITQLIADGINVNVTLLFGLDRYQEVAEAYIAGIKARINQNKPVDHIASVASFFLSRIDVLIDPLLDKIIASNDKNKSDIAKKIKGESAIASAKMAYQIYLEIFNSDEFKKCIEKGAKPQRLLWASTGTKNPDYSDVKYIEALIGNHTVNTVPINTLDAYRDHGHPENRLQSDIDKAKWTFEQLPQLNISMLDVTQQLEDEGVDKFNKAYDKLMATLTSHLNNNSVK